MPQQIGLSGPVAMIALAAILLIALALRLTGIDHGLPLLYDMDEPFFVSMSAKMLAAQDPNPHWFGHPGTTTIYLTALVFAVLYGVTSVLGIISGPDEFRNLYFEDPTLFYISARIVFVLIGVFCCVIVYQLGKALRDRLTGLMAAAITASVPIFVSYSQVVRTDILMTMFALLAVTFAVRYLESRRQLHLILSALAIGFATATKYPALFFAPALLLALWPVPAAIGQVMRRLTLYGAVAGAALFVASPFLFIDYQTTLNNLSAEGTDFATSATGEGFWPDLHWYFTDVITSNVGSLGLFLFIASCVWIAFRGARGEKVVLVAALGFLLCLAVLNLRRARWLIPMIPFAAVLVAVMIRQIVTWWCRLASVRNLSGAGQVGGFLLAGALTLAVAVPGATASLTSGMKRAAGDTRDQAREWLLSQAPPNSTIALEAYGPQLPQARYRLLVPQGGQLVTPDVRTERPFLIPLGALGTLRDTGELAANGVDYFVLSGLRARNVAELERGFEQFSRPTAIYAELTATNELVWSSTGTGRGLEGPPIEIYRTRH